MNLLKKIIISLTLVVTLMPTSLYANNEITKNNSQNGIEEVIKNNDYVDIKKLTEGENGEIIPLDVDETIRSSDLPDGKYLINRGTGWVLGNDESFIKSGYASPNGTVKISQGKIFKTEHQILSGLGGELNFEYVKLAVEVTYEHKISETKSTSVFFEVNSPQDKNIFMKVYGTYNRYDVIKVKNRNIIEHSSTYEPEGSWAKYVEYKEGEYVDQEALEEKYPRCVLGQPSEVKIQNSISVSGVVNNQEESFRLGIDSGNNTFMFSDRKKSPIHQGYGDTLYFKFRLLDKNKNEKFSISMKGNDSPSNQSYDKLNYLSYEIGDYIELYHLEPFRMSIFGKIYGHKFNEKTQLYRIEEEGLTYIDPNEKINESTYKILSISENGKVISSNNNSIILSLENGQGNKEWEFIYDNNKDAYKIKDKTSQLFLTYRESDSKIVTSRINESDQNSYWRLIEVEDGTYIIKNVKVNKVIEVQNGTQIVGNNRTNGNNQKFKLSEIIDPNDLVNKTLQIESKLNSDMVVNSYHSGGEFMALLWKKNNTDSQKWQLQYDKDKKAYKIINIAMGIDNSYVLSWRHDYLDYAIISKFDGRSENYWMLEKVDSDYYIIKNYRDQNKVLTIKNSNAINGAQIDVSNRNNTDSQKFKFVNQ